MFCPNCGKMIPDDSMFCPVCGEQIEIKEKSAKMTENNFSPKQKNTGKIIILSVFGVLILSSAAGMIYFIKQARKTDLTEEMFMTANEEADVKTQMGKEVQTEEKGVQEKEEDATHLDKREEDTYDPTEGGIHRYEYITADVTWEQAFQECINKGGYLVRINSQEEYDYILQELNNKQLDKIQFFVGGRRESGSDAYYWVNEDNELYGEQINMPSYWCASEWLDGEPSFSDGANEEEYLDLLYYTKSGKWTWNDVPDDILSVVPEFSGRIGYICEYED